MSPPPWAIGLATLIAGSLIWLATQHVDVTLPAPPAQISAGDAEVRLCDKEVPLLIESHDLVEVTRAGILVQWMNCSIGKRIKE